MILASFSAAAPSVPIDPSVIVAIIALVSSIGGIFIANKFTARSARDAQSKAATVEQNKLDEQRRQSLMDNMQEEINRIDEMRRRDRQEYITIRDEDKEAFEAHRKDCAERISLLEDEQRRLRRERNTLSGRVDDLILWSRAVVRVMRNAGITYPPPPPGVDSTDPDGFSPVSP